MIKHSNLKETLAKDGTVAFTTSGVSMWPLFRHRKDTIIVTKRQKRLKKYDIALFQVNNKFILHRIVKVLDNSYIICGDNCLTKEYGIKDEQILGYVTQFYRGNRLISCNNFWYRLYVYIWVNLYPIRALIKKSKIWIKKIIGVKTWKR